MNTNVTTPSHPANAFPSLCDVCIRWLNKGSFWLIDEEQEPLFNSLGNSLLRALEKDRE